MATWLSEDLWDGIEDIMKASRLPDRSSAQHTTLRASSNPHIRETQITTTTTGALPSSLFGYDIMGPLGESRKVSNALPRRNDTPRKKPNMDNEDEDNNHSEMGPEEEEIPSEKDPLESLESLDRDMQLVYQAYPGLTGKSWATICAAASAKPATKATTNRDGGAATNSAIPGDAQNPIIQPASADRPQLTQNPANPAKPKLDEVGIYVKLWNKIGDEFPISGGQEALRIKLDSTYGDLEEKLKMHIRESEERHRKAQLAGNFHLGVYWSNEHEVHAINAILEPGAWDNSVTEPGMGGVRVDWENCKSTLALMERMHGLPTMNVAIKPKEDWSDKK
jgi:hypothetical protein